MEGHLSANVDSPEAQNYANGIATTATRLAKMCHIDTDITIPRPPKFSKLG
ncbi:hypothetical protein GCM10022226_32290 [Sphaerisporangium flaviroseum]|uniref:Uncharacterized protein n=1 Tax=Sphaerisporangium flaviroseum TaxID=509199 RepID=A0ABP7I6N0_9ACTN